MTEHWPAGTPVLYGFGEVGYVRGAQRLKGMDGYVVAMPDPALPFALPAEEWVPASGLELAVVGGTVCPRPWPADCPCGLRHVRRPDDLPEVREERTDA